MGRHTLQFIGDRTQASLLRNRISSPDKRPGISYTNIPFSLFFIFIQEVPLTLHILGEVIPSIARFMYRVYKLLVLMMNESAVQCSLQTLAILCTIIRESLSSSLF